MRDYLSIARQYEDDVIAARVPACKWVRLACERNRRDRERRATPAFPYDINAQASTRICLALEQLPHIKGPLAKVVGRDDQDRLVWNTIALEPWQVWILTTLFGWLHVDTNLRRFKTALVLVPRKNAKSTIGAGIVNYMLAADGESGAEVYSAATTRDQAKVVAEAAWEMARRSHAFREFFAVRIGAKTTRSLEVPDTASKFAPLSADENSLDGLNVSCAIVDELHAHRTRGVWDVLNTATDARLQPLIFAITTAGVDIGGICHERMTYLHKVLEQALEDEEFFGVNYTIDEGDDWKDPAAWRKANPNYGISVSPDGLARKAREAVSSPPAVNNFLTKHCNVWVSDAAPWMPMDAWRACARELVPEQLAGAVVRIGVDLAEVRDIAALVAIAWCPDGVVRLLGRFYLPEAAVARSPIAQMSGWVRSGHLIATDGDIADYQRIEDDIVTWFTELGARYVCFDRALAAQMMQSLKKRLGDEDNAKQLVQIAPQSVELMNPAMAEMMRLACTGPEAFQHDGNPAMAWMMSNVAAAPNHKGELYPRKAGGKDSPYKIDGPVAALMAIGMMQHDPAVTTKPSVYETRGLTTFGGPPPGEPK